jgi:hypothetical protein
MFIVWLVVGLLAIVLFGPIGIVAMALMLFAAIMSK